MLIRAFIGVVAAAVLCCSFCVEAQTRPAAGAAAGADITNSLGMKFKRIGRNSRSAVYAANRASCSNTSRYG
jgi:hypothetical protein